MGGHGALICALKNPGQFSSVSAFAPISNPIKAPWGIKAFTGYLGPDQNKWKVISYQVTLCWFLVNMWTIRLLDYQSVMMFGCDERQEFMLRHNVQCLCNAFYMHMQCLK